MPRWRCSHEVWGRLSTCGRLSIGPPLELGTRPISNRPQVNYLPHSREALMSVAQAEATELYGVIGVFDDDLEFVEAARAVRDAGYTKIDACTPFPVHGIDEAMRIPRSPMGFIVFPIGALGAISALLLIWWTGAVDYPLVIGGKPFFAV